VAAWICTPGHEPSWLRTAAKASARTSTMRLEMFIVRAGTGPWAAVTLICRALGDAGASYDQPLVPSLILFSFCCTAPSLVAQ
jgi:hypothetical protein